jgi:hypothetical protein
MAATFMSQISKWVMPTEFANKSSWHLIPRLLASLLTMLHVKWQRVLPKAARCGDPALPLHDPVHCIDLFSKDLAYSSVGCSVLGEAKEVFELCQAKQIDNICMESINADDIPNSVVAQSVVEMRINLTYIYFSSALVQSTFIATIPTNKRYMKYYGSAPMLGARSRSLIQLFRTAIMDVGSIC